MPSIQFDRFYRYEELVGLLQAFAGEYPSLVRLESLGKSFEGREIWLLVITNATSGPDHEKPAIWVDGNIHASEVTASTACLYYVNHLLAAYGKDEPVTRCLDTRALYICPRVNPDGAEWALADRPRIVRSSTRPYPFMEDPVEGLVSNEDIDGDGRLLSMRIRDPNGAWKAHPQDPRLLVRRDPVETGGVYYRLLPEGRIINYNGVTIQPARPVQGLDLNRNFPNEWRQEFEQRGAGPFPTSEPEVRALTEFVIKHNNISSAISFHTMSGALLRPYGNKADDAFPAEDLWTYQAIGKKGTELTGYPNVSIFHEFRYHPKQVISGGFDWVYEYMGMFFWGVEIWAPMREAGIENYKFIEWYRDHPVEDELKMMKWNDEVLGGKGFVNWYPYQHPELGEIELGGWDAIWYLGNPPLNFLEKEVSRFPQWLTWQALITPKLELRSIEATSIGKGAYRLRMVVENTGWLPTYVTKKAVEKKTVRGVIGEITLPEGASLETGLPRQEFCQLEGRAYQQAGSTEAEDYTSDRLKMEWVVHAPKGGVVNLVARHDRAGLVRASVQLT